MTRRYQPAARKTLLRCTAARSAIDSEEIPQGQTSANITAARAGLRPKAPSLCPSPRLNRPSLGPANSFRRMEPKGRRCGRGWGLLNLESLPDPDLSLARLRGPRAVSSFHGVMAGGRPPSLPLALAVACPAFMPSCSRGRSYAARDANMSKFRFRCDLVVSSQGSVGDRKPISRRPRTQTLRLRTKWPPASRRRCTGQWIGAQVRPRPDPLSWLCGL